MNWSDKKLDWNHLRAFLATMQTGTLSGAARVLKSTQPTVGRQIEALETALGVVLFERVGRALVSTPLAAELVKHIEPVASHIDAFALSTAGAATQLEGEVTVTASDVMAAYFMPQAVRRIEAIAPNIRINVVASDNVQSLQRREADIALRHMRPTEPELISRLIKQVQAGFFATPDYVARYGEPSANGPLAAHRFLSFGNPDGLLVEFAKYGVVLDRTNIVHDSASGIVCWELAKQGLGICIMSAELGQRTPEMVQVLTDAATIEYPLWLVTHSELHTSPKIRVVFDVLAEFFTHDGTG